MSSLLFKTWWFGWICFAREELWCDNFDSTNNWYHNSGGYSIQSFSQSICSGNCLKLEQDSSVRTGDLDANGYGNLEVKFSIMTTAFSGGADHFYIKVTGGSSYETILEYSSTVISTNRNAYFPSDISDGMIRIWLETDTTGNNEVVYIDNVCLYGTPLDEITDAPTTVVPTTANPTNFPTKYPTKFPTKYPTNSPTKYPTHFPTTYPSEFPANPCDEETTRVIMSFLYQLTNNNATNTEISSSLNTVTVELIENKKSEFKDCNILSYDIHIWNIKREQETANINITICTNCFKSQIESVFDIPFSDTNNITDNVLTVKDVNTISIDVIRPMDRSVVQSTLYTKTPVSNNVKNNSNHTSFWVVVAVVFCVIMLCCLVLVIVFYRKHKKVKEFDANMDKTDMKMVNSVSMVSMANTPLDNEHTHVHKIVEITDGNIGTEAEDINDLLQNDMIIENDDDTPGSNVANDEIIIGDDDTPGSTADGYEKRFHNNIEHQKQLEGENALDVGMIHSDKDTPN
eukprot:194851_1